MLIFSLLLQLLIQNLIELHGFFLILMQTYLLKYNMLFSLHLMHFTL